MAPPARLQAGLPRRRTRALLHHHGDQDRPAECPYATGAHPCLRADTPVIDPAAVCIRAATYLPPDNRLSPTGRSPVDGTAFDLRYGQPIGDWELDVAYTDLDSDAAGRAWITLRRKIGHIYVRLDQSFGYAEIYTAHDLPDARRRRGGIGIEPMTAPPNALQTHEDVIPLQPGSSHTASWGIAVPARLEHLVQSRPSEIT